MAKYCIACGKLITGRFCSYCGTAQQQTSQIFAKIQPDYHQSQHDESRSQYGEQSQRVRVNDHVDRLVRNTNDEINATVEIMGKRFRISIIIRTIAIILSVLFFLPYFNAYYSYSKTAFGTTSHYSERTTYITYEFMTELRGYGEPILNGSIFALLLILIPVALFAIYNFYRYTQFVKGKLFITSTILSIAGLLINLLYAIIIIISVSGIASRFLQSSGFAHSFSLTPYFSFWFYLAIILYALCGVISFKLIEKPI